MQARWQANKIAPTQIRSRNFSSEDRAARFSQTLQRAWHAFFEEAQQTLPLPPSVVESISCGSPNPNAGNVEGVIAEMKRFDEVVSGSIPAAYFGEKGRR